MEIIQPLKTEDEIISRVIHRIKNIPRDEGGQYNYLFFFGDDEVSRLLAFDLPEDLADAIHPEARNKESKLWRGHSGFFQFIAASWVYDILEVFEWEPYAADETKLREYIKELCATANSIDVLIGLVSISARFFSAYGHSFFDVVSQYSSIEERLNTLLSQPAILDKKLDKILSIIEEKQKSKPPIFKTVDNHYLEWEGHSFRQAAEIELAKELDSRHITFFPSAGIRVTNTLTNERKTLEPDFLVFHEGKWGIIEIDGDSHKEKHYSDAQRARIFKRQGIKVVESYPSKMPPDRVVDDFLVILSAS